jgi:hypothetical protein
MNIHFVLSDVIDATLIIRRRSMKTKKVIRTHSLAWKTSNEHDTPPVIKRSILFSGDGIRSGGGAGKGREGCQMGLTLSAACAAGPRRGANEKRLDGRFISG